MVVAGFLAPLHSSWFILVPGDNSSCASPRLHTRGRQRSASHRGISLPYLTVCFGFCPVMCFCFSFFPSGRRLFSDPHACVQLLLAQRACVCIRPLVYKLTRQNLNVLVFRYFYSILQSFVDVPPVCVKCTMKYDTETVKEICYP